MIISVCICTFNRCDILARGLESLKHVIVPRPEHDIEIIVVDNNSHDQTRELVEALIPQFPFKLRYVFEGQQGISAARNTAIEAAMGDYLAFLDDECIVSRDWLLTAIEDIKQFQPSIIGGPYFGAFLSDDRPKWFKVEYGQAYFIDYKYPKGFHPDFRASSGNMFVRRDVFEAVRFDVTKGPKGDQVKIGEETDLQERFLRAHRSENVFYDPAIQVWHFIRPEKMRLSYRAKRKFAEGVLRNTVDYRTLFPTMIKALAHATLSPVACLWRDRNKYPFWQNFFYEKAIPAACFPAGLVAKYLYDRLYNALPSQNFLRKL